MVQHVVCMGGGFVGGPFGAMIAYQCPEVQVTVVDTNARRIEAWNSGYPPMYEPGLEEILAGIEQRTGDGDQSNLRFSTEIERAIDDADIIVLCVDTPTKTIGIGRDAAPDLSNLQAAVRTIAQVASTDKIVVEKSTVPCGTAELVRDLLHGCSEKHFEVLSNPEFLSEGMIIHDLQHPARVLIGSQQTATGRQATATLAQLYEAWVPRERIKIMDCWSSELAKLAANAMLAQRLSSINSLSSICEAVGGDVDAVSTACGMDPRLGPGMLQSGLGWGGGCFEKDIRGLAYIASSLGLHEVAQYWMAVVEMNDQQKRRFLRRILACMHGSVRRKTIAILGFAFKKNTSDTKGSPAVALVQGLLDEGAQVAIYDPLVPAPQIEKDLQRHGHGHGHGHSQLRISKTAYEACDQAEAVVVVTEWDEFRMVLSPRNTRVSETGELLCLTPDSAESSDGLDWERIVQGMQRPGFVFDGRNVLEGDRMAAMGCRYVRVGQMSPWDASNRYPFGY